jgi:hypothetical protein
MIADFFTKPLQGVAFTGFRNFLLNVDSDIYNDNTQNHRSVLNNDDGNQVVNTTDSLNNNEGFTMVTRRCKKNKVSKKDTIPQNMSSNKVKGDMGRIGRNKRAKAHYI